LKGWNPSVDKLQGTEEYGKQSEKDSAWAKLFIDLPFNEIRIKTEDKKYDKTYSYKQ